MTTLNFFQSCHMNSPVPIPFFVFAYVSRRPRSIDEGVNLPAIQRQLLNLNSRATALGRTLGRRFMVTTTYRKKAFSDHNAFHEAVSFAREDNAALFVGNLADLLSGVPLEQFPSSVQRLDALDIDVYDAATGRLWRDFEPTTRTAIHGMTIARHQLGKKRARRRKKAPKAKGNISRNQALGAYANKRRSLRTAERIRPVVEEMKAGLASGEQLSPSALMHRLNDLGVKGPRSDRWSLNASKRCLQILAGRPVAGR